MLFFMLKIISCNFLLQHEITLEKIAQYNISQNKTVLRTAFSATAVTRRIKEQCYEVCMGNKYLRYYPKKFQALEAFKPK